MSPSPLLIRHTRSHHRSPARGCPATPILLSPPTLSPVVPPQPRHPWVLSGAVTPGWGPPHTLAMAGLGDTLGHPLSPWQRRLVAGRDTGQGGDTEGTPPLCCGQWDRSPLSPAECPQGCPHMHTHTGLCHQVSPGMSPLHAECHQWLKGPVWPPVLHSAVVWVAPQSHPMQGDMCHVPQGGGDASPQPAAGVGDTQSVGNGCHKPALGLG